MKPAWDRFRAALAGMGCREYWSLPHPVARALRGSLREARPVFLRGRAYLHLYAPPVGGGSYRVYLRGLRRMAEGGRVPLVAHVAVTDRCGYACARCSNRRAGAEPAPGEIRRLLGDLRAAGTALVAFTGGEPSLRGDLPEIVRACGPDLSSLLFTSGQGFEGSLARSLREAGLERVVVSLDHDDAGVHDRIRGAAGAFDRALRAVRESLEAGLYTAVQTVAEGDLLDPGRMGEFLEFCRRLGVHEVMLLDPVDVGRDGRCRGLAEAEKARLAEWQARAARDERLPRVHARAFLESPRRFGCQAGFSFVYVSAAGEVCPCDFVPRSFGNAYGEGLARALVRLGEAIPSPSRTCMALAPPARFEDYAPGPPPDLLGWLPSPGDGRARRGP